MRPIVPLFICALITVVSSAEAKPRANVRGFVGPCGAPFAPSRIVQGTPVMVPGTSITFTMPTGWGGRQEIAPNGTPIFRVNAPLAGPGGLVVLAASTGDANLSLFQVTLNAANEVTGTDDARADPPTPFTLGRDCGNKLIARTSSYEAYVTTVRSGAWTYMLVARYPLSSAAVMRGGLDTIVATVHLVPPPVGNGNGNAAAPGGGGGGAPRDYLGCWQTADAHTMGNLKLRADGTYSWTRGVSGFQYGSDPSEEEGRFQLTTDALVTANGGGTRRYEIALGRGKITIDGTGYFPCN